MLAADYNFNPMDPELIRDPYPAFHHLLENDPVHRSQFGFWVVTRFDDARRVLIDKHFGQGDFVRNIQLFYDDDFDVMSHPAYAWLSRVFVMQDPPDHTRLRGLIANALSLKRIRAMEPRIRELAARQLDRFKQEGGDNFITEYAYLFPTLVMCDMLGMQDDEYSSDTLLQLNQVVALPFHIKQDVLVIQVRRCCTLGSSKRA